MDCPWSLPGSHTLVVVVVVFRTTQLTHACSHSGHSQLRREDKPGEDTLQAKAGQTRVNTKKNITPSGGQCRVRCSQRRSDQPHVFVLLLPEVCPPRVCLPASAVNVLSGCMRASAE